MSNQKQAKLLQENAELKGRLENFEKLFDFSGASHAAGDPVSSRSKAVRVEQGVVMSELPEPVRRFYSERATEEKKDVQSLMGEVLAANARPLVGRTTVGFMGHLYFENMKPNDVKEIEEHVRRYVGTTGRATYLRKSKVIAVTVSGQISLEELAKAELETIRRFSGAARSELGVVE